MIYPNSRTCQMGSTDVEQHLLVKPIIQNFDKFQCVRNIQNILLSFPIKLTFEV